MEKSAAGRKDITRILREIGAGDKGAADRLIPLIYDDLRRLARHYIRNERPGHTLQPTALVHEAYMRLADLHGMHWQDRAHFAAVAATLMRRILLDHARRRVAAKRGGRLREQVPLDNLANLSFGQPEELIALDDALARLARLDPAQSQIVEMKFFGGLSVEEIAGLRGISPRKVKREWAAARTWLHAAIRDSKE
jgi:RNA polymerase sigma factor (TIGR02999 family)